MLRNICLGAHKLNVGVKICATSHPRKPLKTTNKIQTKTSQNKNLNNVFKVRQQVCLSVYLILYYYVIVLCSTRN